MEEMRKTNASKTEIEKQLRLLALPSDVEISEWCEVCLTAVANGPSLAVLIRSSLRNRRVFF
jgi:hypothetical protein